MSGFNFFVNELLEIKFAGFKLQNVCPNSFPIFEFLCNERLRC